MFIFHRANSYSFDPLVHTSINKIKNLKTFIVITDDKTKLNIVELEKLFSNKKLMVYEKLDEAVSWVKLHFNKKQSV